MMPAHRTAFLATSVAVLIVTVAHGQGPSTPLVAKYKGSGSTDEAANFVCSSGF